MRTPGHAARTGYALLEVLVLMSVLALVMSMVIMTTTSVIRIERADAAFYDRMRQQDAVAVRFRSDVAQALSMPREWLNFKADKHCLILEHDKDTHIIYQWDQEKLMRLHVQAGIKIPQRLSLNCDQLEFDAADPRLCKLRFITQPRGKGKGEGEGERYADEIVCALGGELR